MRHEFLAVLVVVAAGVILQATQNRGEKERRAQLRQSWKRKIEGIADDVATDPNGWSLDKILECLEEPEWQELYKELEKMPPGKRSLQKAIEICDREGDPRESGEG